MHPEFPFVRRMPALALLFAVLICISGCSGRETPEQPGTDSGGGTIQAADFTLSLDEPLVLLDCDYTFYQNFSYARFFQFTVVSPQEIDTERFSAVLNGIQTPHTARISAVEETPTLPEYVYVNARGIDWPHLVGLEAQVNPDGVPDFAASARLDEYRQKFSAGYETAKKRSALPLFLYRVTLSFDMSGGEIIGREQTGQITMTLNGEARTYDLGSIVFDYTTAAPSDQAGALRCMSAATGKRIYPEADGQIFDDALTHFSADGKLVIRNVSLCHGGGAALESAVFSIEAGGPAMDLLWEPGDTLTLPAGCSGSIKCTLKDPGLAGKLVYASAYYILFEYEADGKAASTLAEVSYTTKPDPYELIFERCCGTDPLRYYYEYYHAHLALIS